MGTLVIFEINTNKLTAYNIITLCLVHVAMNDLCLVAVLFALFVYHHRVCLACYKHKHRSLTCQCHNTSQEPFDLVILAHYVHRLRDILVHLTRITLGDSDRIVKYISCQVFNGLFKRGTEKHTLTIGSDVIGFFSIQI